MSRLAIIAQYEWADWLMGIVRSFVAAAGGAIAAPIGPMATDPKDFNLEGGLHKVLISMGISALLTGLVGLGIFLKTHGAPDKIQESLASAAVANQQAGSAIAEAQQAAQSPPAAGKGKS